MTDGPYSGAELVAVLPSADLDRAELWYGRVGFEVVGSFPEYRIMQAGDVHLHVRLEEATDPSRNECGVYLYVSSPAELHRVHAAWEAAGARIIQGPEEQPYGLVEMATEDPDGNLWRIGAPISGPATDAPGNDASDAGAPPDLPDGTGTSQDPSEPSSGGGLETVVEAEADWFAVVSAGHCEACGLTSSDGPPSSLSGRLRDEAHRWTVLLRDADDDVVRRRPARTVWSALEYGVHVRDVLAVFTERILRSLAEVDPELGWWDHEAAIDDGFANESDRVAVGEDLDLNAARLADVLGRVSGEQWERTATRRTDERFTVELLARFVLHEVVHHRADAERSIAATGG